MPREGDPVPWREGPFSGVGREKDGILVSDLFHSSTRENPASTVWEIPSAGEHIGMYQQ